MSGQQLGFAWAWAPAPAWSHEDEMAYRELALDSDDESDDGREWLTAEVE